MINDLKYLVYLYKQRPSKRLEKQIKLLYNIILFTLNYDI